MVKDLIIDIKEKDLLFEDKSNSSMPVFDVVWGNLFDEDEVVDVLICNIIVPEAYWNIIKYDNRQLIIRFKSPYVPNTDIFRIRPVKFKNNQYNLLVNQLLQ